MYKEYLQKEVMGTLPSQGAVHRSLELMTDELELMIDLG